VLLIGSKSLNPGLKTIVPYPSLLVKYVYVLPHVMSGYFSNILFCGLLVVKSIYLGSAEFLFSSWLIDLFNESSRAACVK